MYATVRTYQGDPQQMDDLLRILDEEFTAKLTSAPGFVSYQALDDGEGGLITISCFQDREQSEATTETAAQFIRERLSDYDIERLDVKSGAVRVSMAAQEALQPAHV
jgi:hypothetical protein